MSTQSERLTLNIDVFDQANQEALALPTLSVSELTAAVLQEFRRDLEFLGGDPAAYQLLKAEDRLPLSHEKPIGEQLTSGQRLLFAAVEPPSPAGTQRPSVALYLRDISKDASKSDLSGKVFPLHWLPAIIGRPDVNAADNERVAVNLDSFKTGLRVSRRHARVVEENGQFFLESLSQNPTSVQDGTGNLATIQRWRLNHGDVIRLDRSGIELKLLIRSQNLMQN